MPKVELSDTPPPKTTESRGLRFKNLPLWFLPVGWDLLRLFGDVMNITNKLNGKKENTTFTLPPGQEITIGAKPKPRDPLD